MYNALESLQAFQVGQGQRKERERENTMKGIGNALAGGNYAGGAGLAYSMGDIGTGMQLTQMGKGLQDAEAEKKRQGLMRYGMGLLQTPMEQREAMRPQIAQSLAQIGVEIPPDQLQSMDLSDAAIQATLQSLQDPEALLAQYQKSQEPYTLGPDQVRMQGNQEIARGPAKGPDLPAGMQMGPNGPEWIPGYLEAQERLRKAGASSVNVNTGDVANGERPIIDKPPKDYQAVWDAESQTYRMEPIPGSAAAQERESQAIKSNTAIRLADQQFKLMTTSIDKAIEQADFWSAGLMAQATSNIGATPARNLKATLDTIMANIGFEKLQEMRETSPTGGALGNVTERELAFLQSVRGSLDQIQDPAQLRQVLGQVKQSLAIIHEIRKMNLQGNLTNSGDRIPTGDASAATDLPPGFEVVQ